MSACADKLPLLNALVDGELDAANVAALEQHMAECPDCIAALEELEALRARIAAAPDLTTPASPELHARIAAIAAPVAPPKPAPKPANDRFRPWRWAGGGAVGGFAVAAALALALLPPHGADPLEQEVIASHVRSLQEGHLIDVATSNRHVVKPWFNGRIDFAPPVPDLVDQGFPLAGGRLDVLGGQTAAALVYRRDRHVINLLVRPARAGAGDGPLKPMADDGYQMRGWRRSGLEYWAVSDVDPAALDAFTVAYRAAAYR